MIKWEKKHRGLTMTSHQSGCTVVCIDPRQQRHGPDNFPNVSEWPNEPRLAYLRDALEEEVSTDYDLSPKACAGVIKRSKKRKRTLPEFLGNALRSVVGGEAAANDDMPRGVMTARMLGFGHYAEDDLASCKEARDYKGATDLVVLRAECSGDAGTLCASGAGMDRPADMTSEVDMLVAVETGAGWWRQDNQAATLRVGGDPGTVIAFSCRDYGALMPHDGSQDNSGGQVAVVVESGSQMAFDFGDNVISFQARGTNADRASRSESMVAHYQDSQFGCQEYDTGAIRAGRIPEHSMIVSRSSAYRVRRLTPLECERIQGFPDGYTDVPIGNRRAPDSGRYKSLGNSWAVDCVKWIGERMSRLVSQITEAKAA